MVMLSYSSYDTKWQLQEMQVHDSVHNILDFWPTTAVCTYSYENTSYWSQTLLTNNAIQAQFVHCEIYSEGSLLILFLGYMQHPFLHGWKYTLQ